MTEVFVGTSGWMYDWNRGRSFTWYVENSKLNAVELNASFYRFPYPSQVLGWARRGRGLRWSVKVHRSITHMRKLSEKAVETWRKFYELFKPLDEYVDFFLFQMPPNFSATDTNLHRVSNFIEVTGLGKRFAIEFRHPSWFKPELSKFISDLGAVYVSIDSPMITWISSSNGIIYLRMHGRVDWYAHDYSKLELEEIVEEMAAHQPKKIYAFFNNDHWMLKNARFMLKLMRKIFLNEPENTYSDISER